MRARAEASSTGPTSFSTRRCTGDLGSAATSRPIRPPMEVPTQSTVWASSRASRVTMSATYAGIA